MNREPPPPTIGVSISERAGLSARAASSRCRATRLWCAPQGFARRAPLQRGKRLFWPL